MDKILVIEDEPNMVIGLKHNLEFEGYTIETAETGQLGLEKALGSQFNLILLDVMLPEMSGFDVLKNIRETGNQTPVIMLTAKAEEIDKVLGLELGADDYITKPFSIRELLARIKAVLRRNSQSGQGQGNLKIGKITWDFAGYEARDEDGELHLSHKEFDIMAYLWSHKNQTVSRNDLLQKIWGYEGPTTRTVDNFILKLRQKIETDPNSPKLILTVHGVGYKLVI